MAAAFAGWTFQGGQWQRAPPCSDFMPLQRPLRIATLNVLMDSGDPSKPCSIIPEVLQHERRFRKSIRDLEKADADVIGLNEVTQHFLRMLADEAWIRKDYTLSTVPGEEEPENIAVFRKFGNVLLSRMPVARLCHIEMPTKRHAEAAIIHTTHGGQDVRTLVTSAHFIAFPTQAAQRANEIKLLTERLGIEDDWDIAAVFGDFNFHREAESDSIPDGWAEPPAALGKYTFDTELNPMIRHYLPKIWWGSFCPVQMRLDRIIINSRRGGPDVDLHACNVRLFANTLVNEEQDHEISAPAGFFQQLWNHRRLPWEEYLFPSDHFGLIIDLACAKEPSVTANL
jgi:poly(A) polymerase